MNNTKINKQFVEDLLSSSLTYKYLIKDNVLALIVVGSRGLGIENKESDFDLLCLIDGYTKELNTREHRFEYKGKVVHWYYWDVNKMPFESIQPVYNIVNKSNWIYVKEDKYFKFFDFFKENVKDYTFIDLYKIYSKKLKESIDRGVYLIYLEYLFAKDIKFKQELNLLNKFKGFNLVFPSYEEKEQVENIYKDIEKLFKENNITDFYVRGRLSELTEELKKLNISLKEEE